jgi:hypothetical protein
MQTEITPTNVTPLWQDTRALLWNTPKGFQLKYVALNGIKIAPSEFPALGKCFLYKNTW